MPRLTTTLLILLGCLGVPQFAAAQTTDPPKLTEEQRKELLKQWQNLDAEGLKQYRAGRGTDALKAFQKALEIAERLYPEANYRNGHADLATSLNNTGLVLTDLGEPRKALPYCERALAMNERLYDGKDHPELATSLSNMGRVLHSLREGRKALTYYERALAMNERLLDKKDHPDLARSLNNMGFVLQSLGEMRKALDYFERALAMRERLYDKKDHPELATSLSNVGFALRFLGERRKSLDYFERSLAMDERLYEKKDHPHLAASLGNIGGVLKDLGEVRKALGSHERALAMYERLYDKKDHPELAKSLNSVGSMLQWLGEGGKALGYYERSLAMTERLYDKKDHPDLATTLNNMGFVLRSLGQARKALPYFERSLGMRERLFDKKDHPLLATSLNNLGAVLSSLGEPRKALDYYERGLAMRERLYAKKDHPLLGSSLHNMGAVLEELGEPRKALDYYERALAMRERLYDKKDHPDLALTLNNMGIVLQSLGESRKALDFSERALVMQRNPIADRALAASEAEVLAVTLSFPLTRDRFLSTCLSVEGSDAQAYAQVWQGKGNLTRLLQARHLAVQAARDEKTLAVWEQLRQSRRDLARLLNTPGLDREDRDKQLRQLNDVREDLERQLVESLPEYQALQKSAQQPLNDLLKALPRETVFVDLLRYRRLDKDGKPHYVAFVVVSGKTVQRIELGEASAIDDGLAAWLKAINAWKPGLPAKEEQDLLTESDLLGRKLSKLLWVPLADKIPAKAVLYLSTDGDLARLPWAALPTSDNRVLLQDHLICQVPHGPFLLERLTTKGKADEGELLAVGGVDYGTASDKPGAPNYGKLPGTATELKQVLALAGKRDKVGLSGKDASTTRVLEELGKAQYVHLATHGEFKEALLSEERKRIAEQLKDWRGHSETGTERVGLGLRNPLSYVGVALAQANEPSKAGPDGGILSGEAIVEKPLEKVRLTVLSACETGLGEYTQGEGVQGLVRAFHVAGCPNVVASLWKVNDDATAALMAKFYRELWDEGKSPAEALRAAQLLLYTQPETVGILARGERGAPNFDKTVKIDPLKADTTEGKRLPPKLWAAFFLSGIGQ